MSAENIMIELCIPATNPRKTIQFVGSQIKYLRERGKEMNQVMGHEVKKLKSYLKSDDWKNQTFLKGADRLDEIEKNDPMYQELKRWNKHWKYLAELRWEARHRTIALALMNGTPIHQIETLPTKPRKQYRKPDWALVAKYVGEATYYKGFQYKPKAKQTKALMVVG